ncbi:imidazole glycerol phosphate synthase subunit HisH [Brevundimonas sp.]|uniref:imidazole glycerol phosphate synthase subunit HisH n=1 Tax=Brevundimonas sp. TaxID=1871086 RepID=UPI002FC831DC
MILIVDIGLCNVGSVRNMLRRIGVLAEIVDRPAELAQGDAVILPGVGHFSEGMRRMRETGFADAVREAALVKRKPVLGICLGMQMLGISSEEGEAEGLGLVPAHFKKFDLERMGERLPVPHMGWNTLTMRKSSPLLADMPPQSRFYFVHSYYAETDDPSIDICTTEYGLEFVSAYSRNNVMGVQFHPEKSHKFGMQLLRNFAAMQTAQAKVYA